MRKILKYIALSIGVCVYAHPMLSQVVIPQPLDITYHTGNFVLDSHTTIEGDTSLNIRQQIEEYLSFSFTDLEKSQSRQLKSVIRMEEHPDLHSEGYMLKVSPHQITIRYSSHRGLFYAVQTLLQLAKPSETKRVYTVPCLEIEDEPQFSYRGIMLDVSRHFFTVEHIKKQIKLLSHYKINFLHLHLTDAAGWRIEIKKYPKLTNFAAWRTHSIWKQWWQSDRQYLPQTNPLSSGGYYTQEQIKELVSYAQKHMITIVPEIEMPSHSEEVLATYPHLSCSNEPYQNSDFCIGNEETFRFIKDVLSEVMELFPSTYIHIGGDEASKISWASCPKCQARMKSENLKHVDQLQNYMINRVQKYLEQNNRILVGWDEIAEGEMPRDAIVMSWRGEKGGVEAIKRGSKAIMTPASHCYLDAYQDAPYTQPEAIGGYLPLKKVYEYNPLQSVDTLPREYKNLLLGVQANLWTEYVSTPCHLEYMLYPRAIALAEVAWTHPDRKSWMRFKEGVKVATVRMKNRGYSPFDISHEVGDRPQYSRENNHLARGKKVHYNASYSPHYPASGDASLTDGLQGNWTYSDKRWQGYIYPQPLDVTIDLESVFPIKYIAADFIQVVGAEVFIPKTVTISISNDGVRFTPLYEYTHVVDKSKSVDLTTILWKGETSARYVRYQATADDSIKGWIFTDEIVIN